VAVAQAALSPAFVLDGADVAGLVRALPRGGEAAYLARAPRWSLEPSAGALRVGGAERLRLLEPLLELARRVVVYAGDDGAVGFVAELGRARLHLVLSADPRRGFSGAGPLEHERLAAVADSILLDMAWQPTLDARALAAGVGATPAQVGGALALLAGRGRVGFDLTARAYFHRELPFDLAPLEAIAPRLYAARALVESGAVRLDAQPGVAWVNGSAGEHRVRLDADPPNCTCDWRERHHAAHGPCRHVLAAQLLRDGG